MLENCFYHLNHYPDLPDEVCLAGINAEYSQSYPELQNNTGDSDAPKSIVSRSRFGKSPFCKSIADYFGGDIRANFIKYDPHSIYDWHTDLDRQVALNFLLRDAPNSLIMFREKIDRKRFHIKECVYTVKKPVIFNSEISHIVINNHSETRYILSILPPMHVTYNDLVEYFKQTPVPDRYY